MSRAASRENELKSAGHTGEQGSRSQGTVTEARLSRRQSETSTWTGLVNFVERRRMQVQAKRNRGPRAEDSYRLIRKELLTNSRRSLKLKEPLSEHANGI